MSFAEAHLEVVKTDYGVFFGILLFNFVLFVHFWLYYIAGTFIALTKVSQCSFPAFGSHSTK